VLARIAELRDAGELVVGAPRPGRIRGLFASSGVRRLVARAGRPAVVVSVPRAL
jgi:hypothetical protein